MGKCSTCGGRLGDMAGLRGWDLGWGRVWMLKVYWPDVLPGPAIAFALGLYDIAALAEAMSTIVLGTVLLGLG